MKSIIKKLAIALLVFIIISVSVTAILIHITNSKKTGNENIIDQITDLVKEQNEYEKGIDIDGTYNENDLIVEKVEEQYNESIVEILKISGLKDKEVENKINNDIRKEIYENANKHKKIDYVDTYIQSNFENVISIVYYVSSEDDYEIHGLNYELINGEKLKLEDIITSNSNILDIVRDAFYEELVLRDYYDNWEYWEENRNKLIGVDENEILKIVKNYMQSENKEFYFTAKNILFIYENMTASAEFIKMPKDIAIYSRFATKESLFERNDIGFKNAFTCSDVCDYKQFFRKIEYGYIQDNLWYDITMSKTYYDDEEIENGTEERINELGDKTYDNTKNMLNEYIEIAKKNPNKFYIFMSKPRASSYRYSTFVNNTWTNTYTDMAVISYDICVYEMPKPVYDNKYKDFIEEQYRSVYFYLSGGAYIYVTDEDEGVAVLKEEEKTELYNCVTGEKLDTLDKIFKQDSNYMEVLEKEVVNNLVTGYGFLQDEAKEMVKGAEYTIKGEYIEVTLKDFEDYSYNIFFDYLNKNMFKLVNN